MVYQRTRMGAPPRRRCRDSWRCVRGREKPVAARCTRSTSSPNPGGSGFVPLTLTTGGDMRLKPSQFVSLILSAFLALPAALPAQETVDVAGRAVGNVVQALAKVGIARHRRLV